MLCANTPNTFDPPAPPLTLAVLTPPPPPLLTKTGNMYSSIVVTSTPHYYKNKQKMNLNYKMYSFTTSQVLQIKNSSLFEHLHLVTIRKLLLLFNSITTLKQYFVLLYIKYFIVVSIQSFFFLFWKTNIDNRPVFKLDIHIVYVYRYIYMYGICAHTNSMHSN